MAGALYGISGFVEGFMGGRNQRNAWEDRKLDRARQERLDGESTEEHKARMRALDRADSDWRRQRKTEQDVAAAKLAEMGYAPNGDPLIEPLGVTATAGGQPAQLLPTVPPQAAAQPQPGQTQAPPVTQAKAAPQPPQVVASTMGGPQPQASQPAAPVARAPGTNLGPAPFMQGPAGGPAPQPMGVAAAQPQPQPVPQGAVPQQTGPDPSMGQVVPIPGSDEKMLLRPDGSVYYLSTGQRETDEGVIQAVKEIAAPMQRLPARPPAPVDPTQAQNDAKGWTPPNYAHDWGESLTGDLTEGARRIPAAIENIGTAVDNARNARTNNFLPAANATLNYVMGTDSYSAPPIPAKPLNGASASPAPSALGAAPASAPQAPPAAPATNAAPGVAPQPAAADAAEKQATQGAIQVTATAGPAMGLKPGEKITPAQLEKAADAGVDYYMREGRNLVVRAYLENGDLAGAQKYQEYLDQKATKDGIKSWSKAIFAMQSGDVEGAGDAIIEAYNNLGYFPDGTTIVKDQSGFVYGDKANPERPTGAQVTFRDEESGKTWVQNFDSPNDFLELAYTMVSPEAGFQHFEAQVAADQTAAAEAAKDAKGQTADAMKRITESATKILEMSKDIATGLPKLTSEQAMQEAIRQDMLMQNILSGKTPMAPAPDPMGVEAAGEAPAEEPIVSRRPTN